MRHSSQGYVFAFIFFLVMPFVISGQSPVVQNVTFEQAGDDIIVKYSLTGDLNKKYNVTVSVSDDFGRTYRIHPVSVEGDIGKNVRPGRDKQIIWKLRRDIPGGLEGEGYMFAVDASLQKSGKKWPYFAGAAVAGGVVYFLTSQKEDKPTTGSITVQVPVDM
jgi:hypothetical protein